jgi:hypothetical protein
LDEIICPLYVHCQGGEAVNVIVGCALWINIDVNNELDAIREWDRIIKKFLTGIKLLVSTKQHHGIPFVVIVVVRSQMVPEITLRSLGPGAPPKVRQGLISTQHTTHRLPTDATRNAHQRLSVFMLTSM